MSVESSQFSQRLASLLTDFPSANAVLFEERWFTWGEVERLREQLSSILGTLGVASGEPIGLVLRERPSTYATLLALLTDGHSVALVNWRLPDAVLAGELRDLRPRVVVGDYREWQRPGVLELLRDWDIPLIHVTDDSGLSAVASSEIKGLTPQRRTYLTLSAHTAVLIQTSGTTGKPKRIEINYSSLDDAADRVTIRDPASNPGVSINVLPLMTIGGIRGIADAVWRGRPLALLEQFDVEKWAHLVSIHHPRHIGVPPAALRMILDANIPKESFVGVEALMTGSAPLHLATVHEFFDRYEIPVLNAYGSTEFEGRVAQWTIDDWNVWGSSKLGSVGRPLANVELRIIDVVSFEVLGADIEGVLEVKLSGPAAPWIRTNDLAYVDSEGFLWIVGRADDVIIRGGLKVPAEEVEAVLCAHPDVAEAVVVGVSDDRLGSIPVAIVTEKNIGSTLDVAALKSWARERLVAYKVPQSIEVVDVIPKNSMMKPMRAQVRERLEAQARGHD